MQILRDWFTEKRNLVDSMAQAGELSLAERDILHRCLRDSEIVVFDYPFRYIGTNDLAEALDLALPKWVVRTEKIDSFVKVWMKEAGQPENKILLMAMPAGEGNYRLEMVIGAGE